MRIALLLSLLAVPVLAGPRTPLRSKKVRAAVASTQPAVVKIFGLKGFRGVFGYRTGVIVHETGLVITRGSVTLDEAPNIACHLSDGRRFNGQVVREDRRSKMVLLKLEAPKDTKFPVAKLGDSSKVRSGQFVILIGNAYKVSRGKEQAAVNLGVVTAFAKMKLREGLSDFPYERPVILHDAMNNPGVYGGPLVNLAGEVVGISGNLVESRATNAQVHYGVPINDLKAFIEDTVRKPGASKLYVHYEPKANEKDEDAPPGFHGIRVLRGGLNRATPAYVDRVVPKSPAATAGVKSDDLILRVDETPIKSWKSFRRVIARYHAGEKVRLTVQRGDDVKLIHFTLAETK